MNGIGGRACRACPPLASAYQHITRRAGSYHFHSFASSPCSAVYPNSWSCVLLPQHDMNVTSQHVFSNALHFYLKPKTINISKLFITCYNYFRQLLYQFCWHNLTYKQWTGMLNICNIFLVPRLINKKPVIMFYLLSIAVFIVM